MRQFILPVAFCLLFAGCNPFMSLSSYEGDVSHIDKVWGGYDARTRYELRGPVFLWKKGHDTSVEILALKPGIRDTEAEKIDLPDNIPTLEQYQQSPREWSNILDILPGGTQIRCTRIVKEGIWPENNRLVYYAIVTKGEHQGLEVDINGLSRVFDCECIPMTLKPNPQLLKVVEESSVLQ